MITRFSTASVFRSCWLRTGTGSHLLSLNLPTLPLVIRKNISGASNIRHAKRKSWNLQAGYFYTNAVLGDRPFSLGNTSLTASNNLTAPRNGAFDLLRNVQSQLPSNHSQHRRYAQKDATTNEDFLPSNLSTSLSSNASALPTNSLRRVCSILLSLSKPRLTVLVVLTACASYALYPVPDLLSPLSTSTPSLSPLTLFFLTSGTALCAASANAFNMLYEPQWDALMKRTRNRPLVTGLISTRWAIVFALLSGLTGATSLYFGVNPTVSFLGLFNIVLYAGVYTPLKRISVLNTWVGALVGSLPPLMGWAAAAGQRATNESDWRELLLGERNIGGWLLACLLFAWQFPHFMSLSWSVREQYKQAGYKMLCWVNPARNSRVALRYSLWFFPICGGLCYYDVTEWSFAFVSAPINAWLLYEAIKFWSYEGARGSARTLFWASVWHLPVVMILAMAQKKGMWQKINRAISIDRDEDEEEY